MFTKKALAFLSINALLCAHAFAAECDDEATRKLKCASFASLNVCNAVNASSFITPSGPLFNGLRNYAVLSNRLDVTNGDNVLWSEIATGNVSPGISVNQTTGLITLPTSGIFLVQYSVRFTRPAAMNLSEGTAQLQQTIAGIPNDITQSALTQIGATDSANTGTLTMDLELTGYALITTTSAANNVINLQIGLTNGMTVHSVPNPDESNAQMIILQLN